MPSRTKLDHELIKATYDELQNIKATARKLEISDTTVKQALRRFAGECVRCAAPAVTGKNYCSVCLSTLAEDQRRKRKERKRHGICAQCDLVVEPPSKTYCKEHRLAAIHTNEKYEARKRRERLAEEGDDGVRSVALGSQGMKQRIRNVRYLYGDAGVNVLVRDKDCCVICHKPRDEVRIIVHHVDGDHSNSVKANMVCMCHFHHQLFHALVECPDIQEFLAWIRDKRPDFQG